MFAISATARAGYQILTKFSEAPLAYLLSAFAAVVYVVATVSLAKPGRTWFKVSVAAVLVELVGVLVVGALSVFDSVNFPHETVWSLFGRGYAFIPLLLPILGLIWLYRRRPAPKHGVAAPGCLHAPARLSPLPSVASREPAAQARPRGCRSPGAVPCCRRRRSAPTAVPGFPDH